MTIDEIETDLRSRGLAPHQVAWGVRLLRSDAGQHQCLVAATGTGKAMTVMQVIAFLIEQTMPCRILLIPERKAVAEDMTLRLQNLVGKDIVERFGRRSLWTIDERISSFVGNPGALRGVLVINQSSLRHDDVRNFLRNRIWDQVIVEVERPIERTKAGSDMINFLHYMQHQSNTRVLALSSSLSDISRLFTETAEVISGGLSWMFRENTPVSWHLLEYQYRSEEQKIQTLLDELYICLGDSVEAEQVRLELRQAVNASLYALEISLGQYTEAWRSIRNHIMHGSDGEPPKSIWKDPASHERANDLTNEMLNCLGNIQIDSKLEAFLACINEVAYMNPSRDIYVFTDSSATRDYLRVSIGDTLNTNQNGIATALSENNTSQIRITSLDQVDRANFHPFDIIIVYDSDSAKDYDALFCDVMPMRLFPPKAYRMHPQS